MEEIYFAQIREDGLVERTAAARSQPQKIACIGSGGCTAFSLLSNAVEKVYCIDMNPAQCALVWLKKTAMHHLDRETFLAFIGESESNDRVQVYEKLKQHLPQEVQHFWSGKMAEIKNGINHCGATEKFYRFIAANLLNGICERTVWEALLACETLEAQQQLFTQHFQNDAWYTAVRILLSKDTHLQFFPQHMFAHAATNDFSTFFRHRFEYEIQHRYLRNNYFLSQFIFGRYLHHQKEGMPHYLTETGYTQARNNLHKLEIVQTGIDSWCGQAQGVDAFMLSNVFDWCTPQGREQLWENIKKAASAKSFVVYRSMLANIGATEQPGYDPVFSASLFGMERSMMYSTVNYVAL